eukprot:2236755-Rhodomonas_salina.2
MSAPKSGQRVTQRAALANKQHASLLDLTDPEHCTETVRAGHGSLIVQANLTVEQRMQPGWTSTSMDKLAGPCSCASTRSSGRLTCRATS